MLRSSQIAPVTTNMMMNGAAAISAAIISTFPTTAPAPPSRMPSAAGSPSAVAITHTIRPTKKAAATGMLTLRITGWRHRCSIFGT